MADSSNQGENRLIAERREKLDKIREGGPAFPNDFRRDSIAGELQAAYGGHTAESFESESAVVSVAGRMMAKRVMGKASFVKIQDRSGQVQLFIERDTVSPELYSDFKTWDVGDIVGAPIDAEAHIGGAADVVITERISLVGLVVTIVV